MSNLVVNRMLSLACLMSVVVILGTCGYTLIEGWTLMDGLYMSLITISTVGYGEIQELTATGRAFTSVLIILSMISLVYWTAGITSILISGDLSGAFQRKKELKMISKLSDHIVVCGGGVMARTVISGLVRESKTVVAIIADDAQIQLMRRLFPDLAIVESDPTSELSLADANVLNAQFLVAAMESDFDNLLITITGNGLGTKIQIYSCAVSNELAAKMLKVGASKVICPMVLCGEHVTSLICDRSTEPELASA